MINANKISSKQNTKVKFVVKLRDRSKRKRIDMFIVEGFREVSRAFDNQIACEFLFFCSEFFKNENFMKLIERAYSMNIALFDVSSEVFEKISVRDGCDEILAICRTWATSLGKIVFRKNSLFLVVDGIEKSGNLGALIRSAESANVDAMFVCNPVTDIFNHNVVRTSQGALFSLPIFVEERSIVQDFLLKNDVNIFATSPSASMRYWEADITGCSAIVVGSEHDGLPDFWLKNEYICKISIPQLGHSDSLNVNDAAVIVLYEAIRQRCCKGLK